MSFCFPAVIPVNTNTMRYVFTVISVSIFLLGTDYFLRGHWFEGPKFDAIMDVVEQEKQRDRTAHGIGGDGGKSFLSWQSSAPNQGALEKRAMGLCE